MSDKPVSGADIPLSALSALTMQYENGGAVERWMIGEVEIRLQTGLSTSAVSEAILAKMGFKPL